MQSAKLTRDPDCLDGLFIHRMTNCVTDIDLFTDRQTN